MTKMIPQSTDKTPAQAADDVYPNDSWDRQGVSAEQRNLRMAFVNGAEWQASQQRGPSVEQIMEVVEDVLDRNDLSDQMLYGKIRSRLTDLLDQTSSQA